MNSTDKGPSAQGQTAPFTDRTGTASAVMAARSIPAGEVREGDWVRWPEDSGTIRRVTEVGFDPDTESGLVYVDLYCGDDDHEYGLLSTQPVEVWRVD